MFASIITRRQESVNPPDPHELVRIVRRDERGDILPGFPSRVMPRKDAQATVDTARKWNPGADIEIVPADEVEQ